MTTVKATFICPSCEAGLNTEDQKRPAVCPSCGYKFGQVKSSMFRAPKTLFQQFREIARSRIEKIPQMPASEDTAEVNLPDARRRYMDAQKLSIKSATTTDLELFVREMSDEYLIDTIDSFEFIVERLALLTPKARQYYAAKLAHMAKLSANVTEGFNLGVRYGFAETEPVPSTSDSSGTGAGGVPASIASS